jgi:hypothetical protein
MYMYNVTCQVEDSIHEQWLLWMREEHIPEVMSTGCFTQALLLELKDPIISNEHFTYAIQYQYQTLADFETYAQQFGPGLKQKTMDLFGDKVVAFRTHLQQLNEFK